MKINHTYNYKSLPKKTPTAPEWDCQLYEFLVDQSVTEQLKIALFKHKKVIDINDNWKLYNIFTWEETIFSELKKLIKEAYKNLNFTFTEKLWINGWVYYARPNDFVNLHNHACHPDSFLSGNLCLTTCNVNTEYYIPIMSAASKIGPLKIPSIEGRMLLFPSYLPHMVTHLNEGTRLTIAFDLVTNNTMKTYHEDLMASDPLERAILL